MCGEIRKPCQPSKLRTDCYVNDSTGVLQQVVPSYAHTKIYDKVGAKTL